MSDNEVEIVVTDKDKTGPGMAAAGQKVDVLKGKAKDVGDAFEKSGGQADHLHRAIGKAKDELERLNAEFSKTGDTTLLKKIAATEKGVENLHGWLRRVEPAGHVAGKGVSKLQQALESVSEASERVAPLARAAMNPYIAGPAVAALALAAIPVAAAAAGAAVAGVGAGFLALGFMGVKGSKEVTRALDGLGVSAHNTLKIASADLEDDFAGAIRSVTNTVERAGPALERVFDKLAPSIGRAAAGFDGLVENALPGLEKLGKASSRVLDDLSAELPGLGAAISNMGDDLASAADGGGAALADTLDLIAGLATSLTAQISFLSNAYEKFDGVNGKIGHALFGTIGGFMKTGEAAEAAADGAEAAGDGFSTAAAAANVSKRAAEEHEEANLNLAESFRKVQSAALAGANAELASNNARAEFIEELKTGTNAIHQGTAASRENREALLDGLNAAVRYGDAEAKRTGKVEDGARAQQKHTDALYNAAIATGVDKREIDKLYRSLGLLPPSKAVKVSAPGAIPAKAQVDNARRAGEKFQRMYTATVQVHGTTAAAASINMVKAAAERADGTYYINMVTRSSGSPGANTSSSSGRRRSWEAHGGIVPGYAGGGTVGAGGDSGSSLAMVGENGPELVRMPVGSSVIPAPTTRAMAGGGIVSASTLNGMSDRQRDAYVAAHGLPTAPAGMAWAEDYSLVSTGFYGRSAPKSMGHFSKPSWPSPSHQLPAMAGNQPRLQFDSSGAPAFIRAFMECLRYEIRAQAGTGPDSVQTALGYR